MENRIVSFEDLEVYNKLCSLHMEVSELTFDFPKFEFHGIGPNSEDRQTPALQASLKVIAIKILNSILNESIMHSVK